MRAAVTILAIVIGLSFIAAVYLRSATRSATPVTPAAQTTGVVTTGEDSAAPQPPEASPAANPAGQAASAVSDAATVDDQAAGQLAEQANGAVNAVSKGATTQAVSVPTTAPTINIGALTPAPAAVAQGSTIGNADPNSPYTMRVDLTAWGAGLRDIKLSHYTDTAMAAEAYQAQGSIPMNIGGQTFSYYPFAARSITINGQVIALENLAWNLQSPGVYTLDLLAQGKPAVRLTRRYSLAAGAGNYEILLKQNIENLTANAINAVWEQSIQAETPMDKLSYMGDQRKLFVGYYNPQYDPSRKYVIIDDSHVGHPAVLSAYQENEPFFWPLPKVAGAEMVWFGEANRYFASVVHRPVLEAAGAKAATTQPGSVAASGLKIRPLDELFPHLTLRVVQSQPLPTTPPGGGPIVIHDPIPTFIYALTSKQLTIAPGKKAELDLAFFAGPRESTLFEAQPYKNLGFTHLIRYELSCAFCTFQWLAKGLLEFLKGIHYVLRDWAMAIIILVLVVRLILHPITKKSQIAMTKMGKQMATLQPEMEKIKKKYADDQTRQNSEIMKLYRERGINPAGMLGCLPMFLQTPIWIALYAMLYFAIELRHQPAFYGVFQSISGGQWAFLADLSSPDNFLHFSKSITLNLYFVKPHFSGINIIPLLMAVFFYLQQALMMPPAANEQQAQQQKIGKYMTLMVPIFLYSAPSGLTLYMLASSIGGMIDGYIVRRHIKQQEADGTLFKAKPAKEAKPGGIWDRIQKGLAAQQEKIANQAKLQQQKKNKR